MWRRKERVGIGWLAFIRSAGSYERFPRLGRTVEGLQRRQFKTKAHNYPLEFAASVKAITSPELSVEKIIDGIGLSQELRDPTIQGGHKVKAMPWFHTRIGARSMLHSPGIKSLARFIEWPVCIRKSEPIRIPSVQNLALTDRTIAAAVHGLNCIKPEVLSHSSGLLNSLTGIRSGKEAIALLPITRRGINPAELDRAVCESHLRECETVKGVSAENAELLAVFQNVPIEMISRLKFVQAKKLIMFTLSTQAVRKSARLHDLAAIRDVATDTVHLVAHRAKFTTVYFG